LTEISISVLQTLFSFVHHESSSLAAFLLQQDQSVLVVGLVAVLMVVLAVVEMMGFVIVAAVAVAVRAVADTLVDKNVDTVDNFESDNLVAVAWDKNLLAAKVAVETVVDDDIAAVGIDFLQA